MSRPTPKRVLVLVVMVLVILVSAFIARQITLSLSEGSLARLFSILKKDENSEHRLGRHIATLEVEIPSASPFILRGTVPIPANVYSLANEMSPFSVEDSDGKTAETQVEEVSHYPDGRPSVVEVIAQVNSPAGAQPGQRVQYKIFEDSHRQPKHNGPLIDVPNIVRKSSLVIPDRIRDIVENKRLVVKTYDVFGHPYTLDLLRPEGGIQINKFGTQEIQITTYGVLEPDPGTPIGPPTGALPHMHNVTGVITLYKGEPIIGVDLVIGNNSVNDPHVQNDQNANTDLYFKDMELLLEAPDLVLEATPKDRYFGEGYSNGDSMVFPFIKPEDDGNMHFMGKMAHTMRYFAIAPADNAADARRVLRDEGLGFAMPGRSNTDPNFELFSWQNENTSNYLTQGLAMPYMDFAMNGCRQYLHNRYQEYYNLLETGAGNSYPDVHGQLGWAHPYQSEDGGGVGGDDVFMYGGVATITCRSREGYQLGKILTRMYNDRQDNFMVDGEGKPINHDDWVEQTSCGPKQPILLYNTLFGGEQELGFNDAPTFQVNYVLAQNLDPAYQYTLDNYGPIDLAHYTRISREAQGVAWGGNDALARFVVSELGALARLSLTEYANSNSEACGEDNPNWSAVTLFRKLKRQDDFHPHEYDSDTVSRDTAWGVTTAVAAYALSTDRDLRKDYQEWLAGISNLFAREAFPNECHNFIAHGQYSSSYPYLRGVRVGDVESNLRNTMQSMKASVFQGQDHRVEEQLDTYYTNLLYSMIGAGWNEDMQAPLWGLPIGFNDQPETVWCNWEDIPRQIQEIALNQGPDHHHTLANFAMGYKQTRDPVFLDYAFKFFSRWSNDPNLIDRIEDAVTNANNNGGGYQYLETAAPTLSLAQQLLNH